MSLTHRFSALAGLALLMVAAAYSLLTFIAVLIWRLRGSRRRSTVARPPVTLLKPLCGAEPGLYENLRSFCLQDYPTFQIVFGVQDSADPALVVARRLTEEFPSIPLVIVINGSEHGLNKKVSNLTNMLPFALHDLLIIADSDAFVGPDYLSAVTAPLLDEKIGLVTCLYRSVPVGGLWSRLGAMYVNDWYIPSVLLAWVFGHRSYASGQTMCFRRDTLRAMGGLDVIANYLANDYMLGEEARKLGLRIVLSHYIPETLQDGPTGNALIGHEVRWMRTVRALAPGNFPFLFVTFTVPLAASGLLLACRESLLAPAGIGLFCFFVAFRLGLFCVPRLADRRISFGDVWLLPVRDLLLYWVWCRALFTSRVRWRGTELLVDSRGVILSHS
jgi:ceramide glucosyltransferase